MDDVLAMLEEALCEVVSSGSSTDFVCEKVDKAHNAGERNISSL